MRIIIGALFIAISFTWLERKFPIRRQKRLRPGWFTDVCHWLFNQTIVNVGVVIGAILLYILLGWVGNLSFQAQVARQPGYFQFLEAMPSAVREATIAVVELSI